MNGEIIYMIIRRKENRSAHQQEQFLSGLAHGEVISHVKKKKEIGSFNDGEKWCVSTYEMVIKDKSAISWIKYIFDSAKPYLNFTIEIGA